MNKNSGFLKAVSVLSIIFLILSLCFFAYTKLNEKNIISMKNENIKLKNDLENKSKEENDLKAKYDIQSKNENEILDSFASKYGYDFKEGENSINSKVIESLNIENDNLLKQAKLEIIQYKDFYNGDFYNSDSYIESVNSFANLLSIKATESLSFDLYNDISLDNFIRDSKNSGTVKYLNSLNMNSKKNNILLFASALYSKELNDIVSDNNAGIKNIDDAYANVSNLYDLYFAMEKYGFNTGDLSSKRLLALKTDLFNINKKYYGNLGVIEILEKGDSSEKTK